MRKPLKPAIHFTHNYLINPTNPITINLIGAGGTGSHMLTALAKMSHSLIALGHPGFTVRLWDDDTVTEANRGRQLFAQSEVGLQKCDVLIGRVNRFFGTSWKAINKKFSSDLRGMDEVLANIYISCVDTVSARYEIAKVLNSLSKSYHPARDLPLYWMDTGNSKHTGQAILATIGKQDQPKSKQYRPVSILPFVTIEFGYLLDQAEETNEPSCSTAEALAKQELFINPAIADLSASLLWQLFREGMTENKGFFLNLKDFTSQALKVA